MSKKIIRRLIAKGHLGPAIELMIEIAPQYASSDTENMLYVISGQYYSNEKAKLGGTIRDDSYDVSRAKINSSITSVLGDSFKEIDEKDIPEKYTSLLNEEPTPTQDNSAVGNGKKPEAVKSDVVLFLSANPSQTALLKLKDEHSNIATELQNSLLKIKSEAAVSFSEFSKAIYGHEPRIVHFSGHGDLKTPAVIEAYRGIGKRDTRESVEQKEEPGIILFDEAKRNVFFVKASVLKELFNTAMTVMDIPIEAVIFNACHSEGQAKAVSEIGITVIGTSSAVKDEAAIAFSRGFYFGLAEGKSIKKSFVLARVQAMAYEEPKDRFILYHDGKKIDI